MESMEMDFDTALREVLKNAIATNGLVRGIHECAKAIEQRKAIVCFLAESCDEVNYTDVVEALCRVHEIPLIKVLYSVWVIALLGPRRQAAR